MKCSSMGVVEHITSMASLWHKVPIAFRLIDPASAIKEVLSNVSPSLACSKQQAGAVVAIRTI